LKKANARLSWLSYWPDLERFSGDGDIHVTDGGDDDSEEIVVTSQLSDGGAQPSQTRPADAHRLHDG
jgi:hypothetical protein